jgi:hypothetical protein
MRRFVYLLVATACVASALPAAASADKRVTAVLHFDICHGPCGRSENVIVTPVGNLPGASNCTKDETSLHLNVKFNGETRKVSMTAKRGNPTESCFYERHTTPGGSGSCT